MFCRFTVLADILNWMATSKRNNFVCGQHTLHAVSKLEPVLAANVTEIPSKYYKVLECNLRF